MLLSQFCFFHGLGLSIQAFRLHFFLHPCHRVVLRKRLFYSIIILNIFPILYAVVVFLLLNNFPNSFNNLDFLLLFPTFWAGLVVFGFQRIYGSLAIRKKEVFPKNYRKIKDDLISEIREYDRRPQWIKDYELDKYEPDPNGYIIPTLYYILLPLISIVLCMFDSILGFEIWIICLLISLILLYTSNR